jgi:hypothetical protein
VRKVAESREPNQGSGGRREGGNPKLLLLLLLLFSLSLSRWVGGWVGELPAATLSCCHWDRPPAAAAPVVVVVVVVVVVCSVVCMFDKFRLTFDFESRVPRGVFRNENECQSMSAFSFEMSLQCHMSSSICHFQFF